MKKSIIVLLGFLLAGPIFSQEIARNSATPLNPDAGRVLELELVFAIDSAPGNWPAERPYEIHIDSRGFFYVLEFRPSQLWKFSPEGKLLGNLVKAGGGSGEIQSRQMASCVVWQDDIYLSDGDGKVIRIDKDGNFADEVRPAMPPLSRLLAVTKDGFIVTRFNVDWDQTGLVDRDNEVLFASTDGKAPERVAGFKTQMFLQKVGNKMSSTNVGSFYTAVDPDDRALYVSHADEYEITKVDLGSRRIASRLTRFYPRIIAAGKGSAEEFMKEQGYQPPPKKDYVPDIHGLLVCDHNLWVQTSTLVEGKGRLFDVFDPMGRYIDSFFVPGLEGHHIFSGGGFLYTLRQNAKYDWTLKKFKILNGPKVFEKP